MAKKPYNWKGAAKINWFPGLNGQDGGAIAKSLFASSPTNNPFGPQPSRGGGGNPYSGLINEYLGQQRAAFAAQGAADAASRDAALRRYVISYGKVPDFEGLGISNEAKGFWKKAIDDKTRALAEKNYAEGTAIAAREEAANKKANRLIPAQLAARGMLRSGQTGADLRDQAQAFKIQSFDTLNEMLGGVENTVGNFLQAERDRQMALAQAEMEARMAAMGDWGGDMYGDGESYDPFAALANIPRGFFTKKRPGGGKRPPRFRGRGGGPYRSM